MARYDKCAKFQIASFFRRCSNTLLLKIGLILILLELLHTFIAVTFFFHSISSKKKMRCYGFLKELLKILLGIEAILCRISK